MEIHGENPPDRQPVAVQPPNADDSHQSDGESLRSFLDLVLDLDLNGHES